MGTGNVGGMTTVDPLLLVNKGDPHWIISHEAINDRLEFGHWEGDRIESSRLTEACLHTEVERMSRKIKVAKVQDLTSESAEAILSTT